MIRSVAPAAIAVSVAGTLTLRSAAATRAWDGSWFFDPAASHIEAKSFSLAPIWRGLWRYDDGLSVQILAPPGGEPIAEPLEPGAVTRTLELGPRAVRFAEVIRGRIDDIIGERLLPDRRHLAGTDTVVRADGTSRVSATRAERVGAGDGLAGQWRLLPDPSSGSPPPPATHPTWITSTNAAGVMTWTIPSSGETLVGAADGQTHPSAGPGQPTGRTFRWEELSPTHLKFRAYDAGRLLGETDDTLSADRHIWAELIWDASAPDKKSLLVYRRH